MISIHITEDICNHRVVMFPTSLDTVSLHYFVKLESHVL